MKTLIVGMGFGELYKKVNTELSHTVVTVDPNPSKQADFPSVADALTIHKHFDTAHICTPNYTHFDIAKQIVPYTDVTFVEKPGFKNLFEYELIQNECAKYNHHLMMTKNNQYRNEIETFKTQYKHSDVITLNWINADRIPNPGTWFTNKQLAFGGISRDLFPHMLSFLTCFDTEIYQTNFVEPKYKIVRQNWDLQTITSTNYGVINKDGVYDVDDDIFVEYSWKNKTILINCKWRAKDILSNPNAVDDISLTFDIKYGTNKFDLGLCPEEAYKKMIQYAIANTTSEEFWADQKLQDLWIHQRIIDLC